MNRKEILKAVMDLPLSSRFVTWTSKHGNEYGYLIGPKMDDNFWIVTRDLTDKPDRLVLHCNELIYDGQA